MSAKSISLAALEAAINHWRNLSPATGDELKLCPQAAALAKPYARMIIERLATLPADALDQKARAAWDETPQNVRELG